MSRAVAALAVAVLVVLLAFAGGAAAAGGNYAFVGGTPEQRAQVRAALDASSFPWGAVPAQIEIRIAPGLPSEATPGVIWLDSDLVDTGTFAWGPIQHEYAHQVDFMLFDDDLRASLMKLLGGKTWCWRVGDVQLNHADYGCERFASTLAWAYWQSDANSLEPLGPTDESAAAPPRTFKRLMAFILRNREHIAPGALDAQFLGQMPRHPAVPSPWDTYRHP